METVFVDILNIETRDELVGKINEEENRIAVEVQRPEELPVLKEYNTDVVGAVTAIKEMGCDIKGSSAVALGMGGARKVVITSRSGRLQRLC